MKNRPKAKVRVGVRAKLIALLVGTSFLALLLACGAFVYYDRVTYAEAKKGTLSVLVTSVAQSAYGPTAFQDPDSTAVILKVLESEPTAQAGAIYTSEGTLLSQWKRARAKVALPRELAKLDQKSGYKHKRLSLTSAIKGDQQVGTLHVVFSTDDIDARTKRFLQIAGGVLAIAIALALLIATVAQRVFTRPVAMLSAAAHRVQEQQDFEARAQRVSDDELGELTDAFNAMLAMIQARDQELEQHRLGLEATVAERTRDLDQKNREMRLVLDNVDQGLTMIDRRAVPSGERSAIFDRWFGAPELEQTFPEILGRTAVGNFREQFAMQWEQLTDGFLPLELNLAQLPAQLSTSDGHYYALSYRPIGDDPERFDKLLVIVSNVTEHVEKMRSDAQQAQLIALLEHISSDRGGFLNFYRETEATIERLTEDAPRDRTLVMRELHTLKGNFGLFGLKPLAHLVHAIEDACIESGGLPDADDRAELQAAWQAFADSARTFLGDNTRAISVDRSSFERLLAAIHERRPALELSQLATRVLQEPVEPKLARMGERAKQLAERLGKGPVVIDVQADGVVAPESLNWLWQVLPHVIANSVDHGLDEPSERFAHGKKGEGKLRISAREQASQLVIEVEDNGRGIDWERVREKAVKLGLPAGSEQELTAALFCDGVTTREQASDVSGRGIGLAAVEAACHEHGATVRVSSRAGEGTLFRFTVANDQTSATHRRTA